MVPRASPRPDGPRARLAPAAALGDNGADPTPAPGAHSWLQNLARRRIIL